MRIGSVQLSISHSVVCRPLHSSWIGHEITLFASHSAWICVTRSAIALCDSFHSCFEIHSDQLLITKLWAMTGRSNDAWLTSGPYFIPELLLFFFVKLVFSESFHLLQAILWWLPSFCWRPCIFVEPPRPFRYLWKKKFRIYWLFWLLSHHFFVWWFRLCSTQSQSIPRMILGCSIFCFPMLFPDSRLLDLNFLQDRSLTLAELEFSLFIEFIFDGKILGDDCNESWLFLSLWIRFISVRILLYFCLLTSTPWIVPRRFFWFTGCALTLCCLLAL